MFDLDQKNVAKLLKNIGVDIKAHVEGYQIKNRIISVWMVNGISLDRFCKEDSIKVAPGVKTGFIRPAGNREITVTIADLDFETPNTFVFEYLNKFGVVKSGNVVYGKYRDGDFKGKYNGERKFLVDFSKAERTMGTYHIIDGAKVRVYYPGNKRTCGRCQETCAKCPGNGIAKDCEE